jgi:hypothetical protein
MFKGISALLIWSALVLPLGATEISDDIYYIQARRENFFRRTWRRLTRRPRENQRSSTVGRGGANRDRCPYTAEELVAVIPVSPESQTPYLEQVVTGHPTWWFYVPYPSDGIQQAEFVLVDTEERILYQDSFVLEGTPGLVSFTWPQSESPLAHGEAYRWVFSIRCNPGNRSGDATVNGWVQRATAAEAAAFEPDVPATLDSYLAYSENLYWFDLLAQLDTLRSENPAEFELEWTTLLCLTLPEIYADTLACEALISEEEALL